MHDYYMHGYCSTCAFMHNFTPSDMGVFLGLKCVKWRVFVFCKTLHP